MKSFGIRSTGNPPTRSHHSHARYLADLVDAFHADTIHINNNSFKEPTLSDITSVFVHPKVANVVRAMTMPKATNMPANVSNDCLIKCSDVHFRHSFRFDSLLLGSVESCGAAERTRFCFKPLLLSPLIK